MERTLAVQEISKIIILEKIQKKIIFEKVTKKLIIIIKLIRMRQTQEKSAILISNPLRKEVLKQILKPAIVGKRL